MAQRMEMLLSLFGLLCGAVIKSLSKLDEKKLNSSTQRSKRMSLKRKVGLPSDRPPSAGLPDWIVNTNH